MKSHFAAFCLGSILGAGLIIAWGLWWETHSYDAAVARTRGNGSQPDWATG
jgi:hypothetical protein